MIAPHYVLWFYIEMNNTRLVKIEQILFKLFNTLLIEFIRLRTLLHCKLDTVLWENQVKAHILLKIGTTAKRRSDFSDKIFLKSKYFWLINAFNWLSINEIAFNNKWLGLLTIIKVNLSIGATCKSTAMKAANSIRIKYCYFDSIISPFDFCFSDLLAEWRA